jgi:antitoxin component of RelBE/YafQ-DinJ toxin-antitoxin module
MSRKTIRMQIRITEDLRDRAKNVASKNGLTLSELIIKLLGSAGDKQLKELAERELKERPKPGRPWDK